MAYTVELASLNNACEHIGEPETPVTAQTIKPMPQQSQTSAGGLGDPLVITGFQSTSGGRRSWNWIGAVEHTHTSGRSKHPQTSVHMNPPLEVAAAPEVALPAPVNPLWKPSKTELESSRLFPNPVQLTVKSDHASWCEKVGP